jgi:hypothetical protein
MSWLCRSCRRPPGSGVSRPHHKPAEKPPDRRTGHAGPADSRTPATSAGTRRRRSPARDGHDAGRGVHSLVTGTRLQPRGATLLVRVSIVERAPTACRTSGGRALHAGQNADWGAAAELFRWAADQPRVSRSRPAAFAKSLSDERVSGSRGSRSPQEAPTGWSRSRRLPRWSSPGRRSRSWHRRRCVPLRSARPGCCGSGGCPYQPG